MLPIVINLLLAVHILVSLLIILLVLMQRPKNEGLGAAFGGGMTENLFGAQTTNVLQTITRWCGIIFFALSLTLSWLYVKKAALANKSSIQKQLLSLPAVAPATPEAAAADEVQKAIQKALDEKKNEAKPADAAPAPEAATPPVKAPEPTAPAASPAPDAKPEPVAVKPTEAPKAPEPATK